ncbi:hypothetical protein KIPB_013858 [Kipferlia bialata]|uniref:Uncharacterized protein n=1 Tax=Kipferlia bialata TaxID=797122 RepID=A0A9K3GQG4_9EUKA|nr:hypothetical protein KIPB_013858 [Kipferlia bialata]|eukprot:g13858.t1
MPSATRPSSARARPSSARSASARPRSARPPAKSTTDTKADTRRQRPRSAMRCEVPGFRCSGTENAHTMSGTKCLRSGVSLVIPRSGVRMSIY